MKLILTQQELELIVSEELANQGIDLSDKTLEFTFLEGAEIDINSAEKPKRKRKSKAKEPVVEDTTDEQKLDEEPAQEQDDPFGSDTDEDDDSSLFG